MDLLDNVSFFKIGLRLFLAGDLYGLVQRIRERRDGAGIFIDLKMAGDISNTISDFVERASELGVRFITLAESRDDVFTRHSLAAGRRARGSGTFPQFLMVPLLSSLVPANFGRADLSAEEYILGRGREMLGAGCDGLIVSGAAIGACRAGVRIRRYAGESRRSSRLGRSGRSPAVDHAGGGDSTRGGLSGGWSAHQERAGSPRSGAAGDRRDRRGIVEAGGKAVATGRGRRRSSTARETCACPQILAS